eukprot:jgi/Galph1/1049/GphlegSOOS_G5919.1
MQQRICCFVNLFAPLRKTISNCSLRLTRVTSVGLLRQKSITGGRGHSLTVNTRIANRRCFCSSIKHSVCKNDSTKESWQFKLLYDGQCPLCQREVAFLKKHDKNRGIVQFVDISDRNYSPEENANISYKTAMGRIHAIQNDGTVVTDLEVFRRVYDALGIGWIYFPTKLPVLRRLAESLYRIWANWRLPLTGRSRLFSKINCSLRKLIFINCH